MALIPPKNSAGTPAAQASATSGGASWLKTGAASAQAAVQAQAEAEKRKEEQGKAFRFWLAEGEEARITFVDGDLVDTPEGKFLLPPRYYEHNLMLNGQWGNHFVCPEKTAPHLNQKCPICESGDRPSLVALFTVIDHREFTSKDKTKTYKDTVKLFVANAQAFEILNKLAQKVGGLAGSTWDVSRAGDKSPRTGNSYFPQGKETDLQKLRQQHQYESTDPKTNVKTVHTKFAVLDYEKEIIFRDGDALRAMGLGKPPVASSTFGPSSNHGGAQTPTGQDYSQQL
jgi:hypothetical protein